MDSFNLAFYTSPNGGSNPNTTAALKLNYDNSATFSSSVTATVGNFYNMVDAIKSLYNNSNINDYLWTHRFFLILPFFFKSLE